MSIFNRLRGVFEAPAATANQEDHSDPWLYMGDPADAPLNVPRDPNKPKAKTSSLRSILRSIAWRNCNASLTLIDAVNAKWPNRDRASDGTIGDAAHATRSSDHNPWIVVNGVGVVRARDIDKDGIDAAWLAEELRKLGAAGDARLTGGGYVIFNRRITRPDWSGWNAYYGSNPHTSHLHVSFSRSQEGFDNNNGWVIFNAPPPPPPAPVRPTLRLGDRGQAVWDLQRKLTTAYSLYNKYEPTGYFGSLTEAGVKEFQRRSGLVADGIVGPATWRALGF